MRDDVASAALTAALDRADRRPAHLHALARPRGHDRHDHRLVPRRSPRARSATPMSAAKPTVRSSTWTPNASGSPRGRAPGAGDDAREQHEEPGCPRRRGPTTSCCRSWWLPAREPHGAARGVGRRISEAELLQRHVRRGDLLRGDRGLRQLRGRPRDGQHRDAAGLRARAVGAHHPARRRDARGARHRPAAARRARHGRCSPSTGRTSIASTASWTPTSRRRTGSR
jgi:hypothetical protein